MAESVWIQSDIDNVVKALSETSKSIPSIQKQAIGIIAKGGIKAIKGGMQSFVYSQPPAKGYERTGELLKCYGYRVKKDGSSGSLYPKGISGDRIFPKVYALNYGDDVRNKPHSFVEVGQTYIDSGAYEPELMKMVDKTLDKYWR